MLFVAENSKVDRSATAAVFEISKEINESTSKKDATESDAATSDKVYMPFVIYLHVFLPYFFSSRSVIL